MALIRGLPEEARWTQKLAAELVSGNVPEFDEAAVEAADREFWNADRQLIARLHNAIVQNTQLTGNWEKGKVPELPLLGPQDWEGVPRIEPAAPKEPQPGDPDFLMYHLSRLGMPAGGGRM